MSESQKEELTDVVVKQMQNYTLITINGRKFMTRRYGPNDSCARLNIGSYTEFPILDEDIDATIKFLEWYKKHKNEIKVIEPPERTRYDDYF